jgi:hypothetical protein
LPSRGKNPETHALQDLQANNLVNPIPLLGLEFFAKMDILEVVLRAVLRHKKLIRKEIIPCYLHPKKKAKASSSTRSFSL